MVDTLAKAVQFAEVLFLGVVPTALNQGNKQS